MTVGQNGAWNGTYTNIAKESLTKDKCQCKGKDTFFSTNAISASRLLDPLHRL